MAAAEIDRMAVTGMRPHILSIACGHLREADRLQSLPRTPSAALLGWIGIRARSKSCARRGRATSLRLSDYLSGAAARRLLSTAFDMLNPGGKVSIANFVEDLWSAGYMEAGMDGWLIYRSETGSTLLHPGSTPASSLGLPLPHK
jgi:hypothetical protein